VLIIDDEPGIRFALQRWFARQSWDVLEAGDGEDGLALLLNSDDESDTRIDLVVCDLHLPRMNGEALHAIVLSERPAFVDRIIFSTGDAVTSAPADSILATHPHVLQKPFELSALRLLIQGIVPPS
jgi:DNA-binding response OmpR family regulator